MFEKENQGNTKFTREELQDILSGVKNLSVDDLAKVFAGAGDEREEYTLDADKIERDIFGSKF